MNVNPRLVAIRKAHDAADAAQDELDAFVRKHGTPRGIMGERHTAEMRAEYYRLMAAADAAWTSYFELKHNVQ